MIMRKKTRRAAEPGAARLFGPAALAFLGFALPVFSGEIAAGDAAKTEGPKVFVVSREFDAGALLKAIPFVAPVATREEAQVEVLIDPRGPAPGTEFLLTFTGLREFAGRGQTLTYAPRPAETREQVEAGLSRTLQMGLMRFVAGTPAARRVRIGLRDRVKPTDVIDRWNSWVFSASANGMFQDEKTYASRMFFGSFSANRVTPALKVRMSLGVSTQRDRFEYGDEEIRSRSESRSFEGLFVKSLDDHWSTGAYVSVDSSTFQNIRSRIDVAPAIEYDLFPYSESTKRQLRFLYRVGFSLARYREETIYDKTRQNLLREHLEVALEFKKKWGTISTSFEASNYFHDFRKNQLELNGEISVRVFKGLSFNMHGGGARIHDQIFLPKGGATLEEVLLRRKQLATNYDYFFSVGFSYSFGSIFSNVVNPRFGSGGGGVSIQISN